MGRNPCTQFLHRHRPQQPSTGQWLGTCSTPGSFETCRNVAAPGLGDRNRRHTFKVSIISHSTGVARARPHDRCIHSYIHSFNRLSYSVPDYLYLIFNQNNKVFIFITRATEKLNCCFNLSPLSLHSIHPRPRPAFCASVPGAGAVFAIANLLRRRSMVASDLRSAGALATDRRLRASLEPVAVRKRATSPFPSSQSLTRPSFPLQKPAPGRAHPVRRPKAALRRRFLHSRKIMYQPSRGAAQRLAPCLRAYQAHPQVRAEGKRERGEGAGRDPHRSRCVGRGVRPVPRRRGDVPPSLLTCARWRSEGLGVAGSKWVAPPALARTGVLSPESGVGRRDWRSGYGAHPHVARDSVVTFAWR